MGEFHTKATTVREGIPVDEIEFAVPGSGHARGYFLRRRPGGDPRPLVVAIHDGRGDKAGMLPDLQALAAKGFSGVAIDSPATRTAIRDRDHLAAVRASVDVAQAAVQAVSSSPDIIEARVAIIGRGIGAEAAGVVATQIDSCRLVIAAGGLPNRGRFLGGDHPVAAAARLVNGDAEIEHAAQALEPLSLISSMQRSSATWLVQVVDDDDRVTETDRRELAFDVPHSVRIGHYDSWADLGRVSARTERVDFVRRLI